MNPFIFLNGCCMRIRNKCLTDGTQLICLKKKYWPAFVIHYYRGSLSYIEPVFGLTSLYVKMQTTCSASTRDIRTNNDHIWFMALAYYQLLTNVIKIEFFINFTNQLDVISSIDVVRQCVKCCWGNLRWAIHLIRFYHFTYCCITVVKSWSHIVRTPINTKWQNNTRVITPSHSAVMINAVWRTITHNNEQEEVMTDDNWNPAVYYQLFNITLIMR